MTWLEQAFWQPIECPGQLGTRFWDQKTQSWLNHSHHWVCSEHAVPRRLFSCWCSQMNFLKTPFSGKLVSAQLQSHPLGKWPHPLHQKPLISTRFSCSTGWGSWIGQCPSKKKSNNGHLSIQIRTFKSIIDGPQIQGPHPQNRSDRIGFVHFWRRGSQGSGGLGGARVEAARACWRRRLAADQTPMVMVIWWVSKSAGAWCKRVV